jgi:hypothetical protein
LMETEHCRNSVTAALPAGPLSGKQKVLLPFVYKGSRTFLIRRDGARTVHAVFIPLRARALKFFIVGFSAPWRLSGSSGW